MSRRRLEEPTNERSFAELFADEEPQRIPDLDVLENEKLAAAGYNPRLRKNKPPISTKERSFAELVDDEGPSRITDPEVLKNEKLAAAGYNPRLRTNKPPKSAKERSFAELATDEEPTRISDPAGNILGDEKLAAAGYKPVITQQHEPGVIHDDDEPEQTGIPRRTGEQMSSQSKRNVDNIFNSDSLNDGDDVFDEDVFDEDEFESELLRVLEETRRTQQISDIRPGAEYIGPDYDEDYPNNRPTYNDNDTIVVGDGPETSPGFAFEAELVEDTAVSAVLVTHDVEGIAQQNLELRRRVRRNRRLAIVATIGVVILVAGIVGAVVGTQGSNRATTASQPTPPPASQTPPPVFLEMIAPTSSPTLTSPPPTSESRSTSIRNFLVFGLVSNPDLIDTPGSAQNQAVEFLVSDTVMVPLTEPDSLDAYNFIERYALAVLFFSTEGVGWRSSFNFLDTTLNSCRWNAQVDVGFGSTFPRGAVCDDDSGHVTTLSLESNNMIGMVPSELGLLSALQRLDLSLNTLSGLIPDSFQGLTALTYLGLYSNQFFGSFSWIGQLTSLEILAMSNNNLGGSLPRTMSALRNLSILALDGNSLSGNLNVLRELTNLERVLLSDNFFQSNLEDAALDGLSSLDQLDLSGNSFYGAIPAYFFQLQNLTVLDLNSNMLNQTIPSNITMNTALSLLALYSNEIIGSIPTSIHNLEALNHLDLSSNSLTSTIPDAIGLLPLRYLYLSENNFDSGVIPSAIHSLSLLTDLSLRGTGRAGSISTEIGLMTSIRLLDLGANSLSGQLPDELEALPDLRFLLLDENFISGTLPDGFPFLSELLLLLTALIMPSSLCVLDVLLVQHNSLVGSVEGLCGLVVEEFIADCGGSLPLVFCSCCTVCCEDGNPCVDASSGRFDPQWEFGFSRPGYFDFASINV